MLGKLIKHEFRATSRAMWSIYIGMVLLALLTRYAVLPLMNRSDNFFINSISVVILVVFFAGMFAMAFAPLVESSIRFKHSILGNEGYLTMTLPVSSHSILCSKLIVNAVWYAICGVLIILIGIMMVSGWSAAPYQNVRLGELFNQLIHMDKDTAAVVLNLLLISLEAIIDIVALITVFTTMVYASYAIGYSAQKRKSLWTVLLIYGLFHLTSWAAIGTLIIFGANADRWVDFETGVHGVEGFPLVCFVIMIAVSAVYYFITNYFITRKLNLE